MDSFGIVSSAVSDRGLSEKRPENEDSYLEMPERGVFAVADGVGGAQAGEVASQMAMEILAEAFANQAEGADAEDTLKAAIERANSAIHQMANELPQLSSMATTVVALHLEGDIATIGHVGDSRLYRVDSVGNLHRETADHSVVGDEVRAGRMTEEQAESHPSRNVINRALGAEPTVEVDVKTIMIEPGTAFLICSDGITRHVSDEEIRKVLAYGGGPVDICTYLKNLCYERGAEDNLTAVVVRVGPAPELAEMLDATADLPTVADSHEERTVATARSPFDSEADDEPEELDTRELILPDEAERTFEPAAAEAKAEAVRSSLEPFSIFSESGSEIGSNKPERNSGSAGRTAIALGMLVLGSIIGLGVYHFAIARPEAIVVPGLQEMKVENIPFNTYEKNRRNVDADPAAYIKEVPPAQDAADFYLLGRAYMLTGDLANARMNMLEAQKRLRDAEPANAKVLATDIATGIALTADPGTGEHLKSILQLTTGPTPSAANAASPR